MKAQRVTKTTLAKRMGTTRAQLDRILDPENTSMTLMSMVRTAAALGQRLDLDLGAR
jgi:DNA-binding phage protein